VVSGDKSRRPGQSIGPAGVAEKRFLPPVRLGFFPGLHDKQVTENRAFRSLQRKIDRPAGGGQQVDKSAAAAAAVADSQKSFSRLAAKLRRGDRANSTLTLVD